MPGLFFGLPHFCLDDLDDLFDDEHNVDVSNNIDSKILQILR
jgi:hypothetical protein